MVNLLTSEPEPEPDIPPLAVNLNQQNLQHQRDNDIATENPFNHQIQQQNVQSASLSDPQPPSTNDSVPNVPGQGGQSVNASDPVHTRQPSILVTSPQFNATESTSQVPTSKSTSQPGRARLSTPIDGASFLRVKDFASSAPTKAWNAVTSTVGAVGATAVKGANKVTLPSIDPKAKARANANDEGVTTEKDVQTGSSVAASPVQGDPPVSTPRHDGKARIIEPTWKRSFINTMKSQPMIFLIPVLLPISWALHFSHQNPAAVFTVSLLAVVPLAGGLSFATEELAVRLGDAWGGLLNATFGNAVELLIAILALVDGQLDIVQASMIGSILSNILLVLGMSYFAGGLRFHEQMYGIAGAQMHISLLGITLAAIVMPAAYHFAFPSTVETVTSISQGYRPPEGEELTALLAMSRGLSIILLVVYGMFLTFQLYTHAYLFRIPRHPPVHPLPGPQPHHDSVFPVPSWVPSIVDSSTSSASSIASRSSTSLHTDVQHHSGPFKRLRRWSLGTAMKSPDRRSRGTTTGTGTLHGDEEAILEGIPLPSPMISPHPMATGSEDMARTTSRASHASIRSRDSPRSYLGPTSDLLAQQDQELAIQRQIQAEDEEEYIIEPKVRVWFAVGMLTLMTALAGITAEWLVESIDGLTATGNVSREFVGLILLPVIGNSVEHITAVTVSVKDKLNLSMSIAVGSSIQVSLCLLPILVLIGWAIGQPMMLFFDVFETIIIVIAVLLVNFAISDGRTNWLEGATLIMAYVSIALVAWYYDPVRIV